MCKSGKLIPASLTDIWKDKLVICHVLRDTGSLLIGETGNVSLQIRVFSALLVPGLFSGSVRAHRQVAVRMGTSSHPGRLTQPREVAQLCWSWATIRRASALLPSQTSENPASTQAAKLCPCSRLLLAVGKQPRLPFGDEIPLFAPPNLC